MKQRILKDKLNFHSDPVWGDKGVKLVLCFSCISPVSQVVTLSCTFLLAWHIGHITLLQRAAMCVRPGICHLWRLLLFLLLVKMETCLYVITIQLPFSWDICSMCILPPGGLYLFTSVGWPPCWFCRGCEAIAKLWDLSSGDIILSLQFRVSLPSSCVPALRAFLGEMLQGRTQSSAAG